MKIDIMDMLKLSFVALLFGAGISMVLGLLTSMLSGFSFVTYILYALILVWAVPKLPKEADTFFDVLMVTFLLLAFQALLGMFLPQVAFLQWVNITTVMAFLATLVTAIVALALVEEYVPHI